MFRVEPSGNMFVALIWPRFGPMLGARFVVSLQSLRKTVAIISCAEMICSAAMLWVPGRFGWVALHRMWSVRWNPAQVSLELSQVLKMLTGQIC